MKANQKYSPLWRKIAISVSLSFIVLGYVAGKVVERHEKARLLANAGGHARQIVAMISAASIDAIISRDRPVLQTVADQVLAQDPDMLSFVLTDVDKQPLASASRERNGATPQTFEESVKYAGEEFGGISIAWDVSAKLSEISGYILHTWMFLGALLGCLLTVLYLWLQRLVLGPLTQIGPLLLHSSDRRKLNTTIPKGAAREIAYLYQSLQERLETEDALQFSRFYIEHAGDPSLWVEPNGDCTHFNKMARTMLSLSEAPTTLRIHDIIASWTGDVWQAQWEKLRDEGQGEFEVDVTRFDGSTFRSAITASYIRHEGREYLCLFLRDISARLEYERELKKARLAADEANAAKSQFLANMSHEIRTPMNGVMGMADVMLATSLTPQQQRYLGVLKSSAQALLNVINEILDFSKIESGKLTIEAVPFSLDSMLVTTMGLMAPVAEKKKLELTCFVAPEVPAMLHGDPTRIQQILINLIGNAVKFTATGEVSVGLRWREDGADATRGTLECAVRDTGIGMSPEVLKKLFTPFTQADGSTTRKFGGTGLGLSISLSLAKLMGGTIRVESTEGVGTTFTAELPNGRPEQPATGDATVAEHLRGKTALIVDANASARRTLAHFLSQLGMTVTLVMDGAEALSAVRSSPSAFDLCIANHALQDMDGFALHRQLCAEPHPPRRTIMLLSFTELTTQSKRCVEQKLDGYTTKPVTRSALMQVFQDILDPQSAASRGRAGGVYEPPRFTTSAGTAPRVLVADDNETNRFVISNMLSQRGIQAECVADGQQALDMLAQHSDFACVFLDLQMPTMGGEEAVQHIRRSTGRYASIPVVALTAHAMKGDAERCIAMGMSHYLSKPIESEKLDGLLGQLLITAAASDQEEPQTPGAQLVECPASPTPNLSPASNASLPPTSVVDAPKLMAQFDNSVEFLAMAIEIFTRESAETVRQLGRALADRSCEVAARHGHKLAGSVASMSHGDVLTLVRQLEHQAKAGDLGGAQATWEQLEPAYTALCTALADLVKQHSPPQA